MSDRIGTIDEVDQVLESLVLSFSPSLLPLRQRWRNNGLSADFLGDYVTTFFPSPEDDSDTLARQSQAKGAVSYIANELLENAMKYTDSKSDHPITITLNLEAARITFQASNPISADAQARYAAFAQELSKGDPMDIYMRILENGPGEEGGSGLGLVTMINDYEGRLCWSFETDPATGDTLATTWVQIPV
ncbi:slr1658 superfamily regulator [Rhodospirillum sp. A1_3_36]|uniref:slr1658 superfamily regulator n=1 Tax=Rhodospirillum sp. A1_3_36 TaxID=3391666 RepID=UPI0039A689FF